MKHIFASLLLLLHASIAFAQSPAAFTRDLQEEIRAQRIPALSVLVFKGNTILFETTLGHANIAENIPLSPDHPFLLASISKTVTATALLQLYQAGKFALDDPINDHLPFPVQIPGHRHPITFRMLLTHTAAIADGPALDEQYYNNTDSPVSLNTFLRSYLAPNGQYYDRWQNFYDFPPGDDFAYSNTGYALIGLLVERISGQNFSSYTQKNIFRPLGMVNTHWHLREISGRIVQPYDYSRGQFRPIPHYTFTDYPNGGLRSTARDMHRFLSSFTTTRLFAPASIRQIFTPQIPSIDRSVGLGMFLMNRRLGLWGHDGGEKGAATLMAFNPGTRVGAIILANQGEANLDGILAKAYRLGLRLSGG